MANKFHSSSVVKKWPRDEQQELVLLSFLEFFLATVRLLLLFMHYKAVYIELNVEGSLSIRTLQLVTFSRKTYTNDELTAVQNKSVHKQLHAILMWTKSD